MTARSSAKLAAVFVVVAGLVVAERLGVFHMLREPAQLAQSLVDLGAYGYVAFIVAYALLQPFGVPGTIFIMAAPLIWPWPVAFALSMTGTMCASVIGFAFARFMARDWLAERIPQSFKKYDELLARRAFFTVFVLRLVFWMPPLLHAFFGISKVRGVTHFWGSLVGYIIPLFLVSYFGQKLFDFLRSLPARDWIILGVAVAVISLSWWLWRRRRPRATSA